MADNNFLIEKTTENESTRTVVSQLDSSDRIKEIARLLGGSESSETSMQYAEEMINNAKMLKKT